MSVHLVIENTRNKVEISIPVSSQDFFYKAWRPFAKMNSLRYIEQMGIGGFDINKNTIQEFIRELEFMHNHITDIQYLSLKEKDDLKEKIQYILDSIKCEESNPNVEGWIG